MLCTVDTTKDVGNKASLSKKTQSEVARLLGKIWDTVCLKMNEESDDEAEKKVDSDIGQDDSDQDIVPVRKVVRGKRTLTAAKKVAPPKPKASKMQDTESDENEDEV